MQFFPLSCWKNHMSQGGRNRGSLMSVPLALRERAQRSTLGSGDRWVGWGFSTRRGGGQKVRAVTRKFVFPGFWREEPGMSGNFAGMSRTLGGLRKVCAKKLCDHFWPLFKLVGSTFAKGPQHLSKMGRIRLWRVQFQTPNSVSLLVLNEVRGDNSVSFLSACYLCAKIELSELFAELTELAAELSEFVSSETVLSKQCSARFPIPESGKIDPV